MSENFFATEKVFVKKKLAFEHVACFTGDNNDVSYSIRIFLYLFYCVSCLPVNGVLVRVTTNYS